MATERAAVLVTGAASGIGKATAERLHDDASFDYVACLDIDETVEELYADKAGLHPFQVDHRNEAAVQAAVETIRTDATLTAVVNAAGVSQAADVESLTSEDWDRVVDVNLKGQFTVVKAASPALRANESGYVVNVSSTAGQVGSASGGVHYSASKAGVIGLTKGLAKQLGPDVRVNCVVPGLVETPMLTAGDLWTERELAGFTGELPAGRVGESDEIARVIQFLCGDGAAYMTGSVVNVDGGLTIR